MFSRAFFAGERIRDGELIVHWGINIVGNNRLIPFIVSTRIKPGKNSIFLKNGKIVILVENRKFSRSRMMMQGLDRDG